MPTTTAYDTLALVDRLISEAERRISLSFAEVVADMREHHSLAALATFIEAGQVDAALAMVESYASRLASVVNRVYIDAGQEALDELGDRIGVVVSWDVTNARAVQHMAVNRLELVREFTEQQVAATRAALFEGVTAGINPREMAREFRDSIGLTARQQRAVANYRGYLEQLDRRALERQLRDRRFDRAVLRAIDTATPLSREQIDRMVGRYRERYIKYRAETIARTEALEAAHSGVEEGIRQGVESGAIDPTLVTDAWNTADDERVRDFPEAETSHRTMQGQQRPFGEPFTSGAGNDLQYPGDRTAPPEETIQCRCRKSTRVRA